MLKRLNQSAKVSAVICMGVFLLLLVCNVLTPYFVDDFTYVYSFATGEPLQGIGDIIPSMAAHRETMNGRVTAHTLVQLFALMPNWVFDVVNSLVFAAQVALIAKLSGDKKRNNVVLLAVFCAIWLYEPAFGQVNLWQDGAFNYLWSIPFGLLFMMPFVKKFLYDKQVEGIIKKALFLLLAFAAGSYSETVSVAIIFMALLLIGLDVFYQKKKPDWYLIAAIAVAFLGYVSIYLAPAQWDNKSVETSAMSLLTSALYVIYRYEEAGFLLIPFVVLLAMNVAEKTDKKRIILALVFLAGSLAANCIMVFAAYYHSRSAIGAFIFLVVADAILLQSVFESKRFRLLLACTLVILPLITIPQAARGVHDITETYLAEQENQAYIRECKAEGILDVELPVIEPETPYSAVYGLKYLDTEETDVWPNDAVAKFYGLNSIIGVESQEGTP